jgi:hypothetical protein
MDLMDLLKDLPFTTVIQVRMPRFNVAEVTWTLEGRSITKVIRLNDGWAADAMVADAKRMLLPRVDGAL